MPPIQLWLFEQPPVTWPEVELWCIDAVGIDRKNWRFKYYIENWNVADKIRAAKVRRLATAIKPLPQNVGSKKTMILDPPHRRKLSSKKAR